MFIRTITSFVDPGYPFSDDRLEAAGRAAAEIKAALHEAGYTVQTMRLALPPLARLVGGQAARVEQLALDLEAACFIHKFDYASLGPVRPGDAPEFYAALPPALESAEHVFTAASVAEPGGTLSLPAARQAAEIIQRNAHIRADGFGNLRFAVLANVPAGTPFFPAAYHESAAPPAFALGLEAAELAVLACAEAASVAEARARLIGLVEEHAQRLQRAVRRPAGRGPRFAGLDFTLAPFPEAGRSLGTALEKLTGQPVGSAGTLAAAASLADALDRARVPHTGFAGLFFPVLEDAVLAARAAEGRLTVNDLLLYSTVCGAGLDTLPLPGDIGADTLAAILADVGALALRLNKPLTARLMPIPGKLAGDEARFPFAYFAPSRVLAAPAGGLGGLLAGSDSVELGPRQR
jgi:uncharacterized protein (UPF0210 family)